MTPDSKSETPKRVGPVAPLFGEIEAKLWNAMQLKADMFDYLCWLEDYCAFRQAALDGKADDYLVLAALWKNGQLPAPMPETLRVNLSLHNVPPQPRDKEASNLK